MCFIASNDLLRSRPKLRSPGYITRFYCLIIVTTHSMCGSEYSGATPSWLMHYHQCTSHVHTPGLCDCIARRRPKRLVLQMATSLHSVAGLSLLQCRCSTPFSFHCVFFLHCFPPHSSSLGISFYLTSCFDCRSTTRRAKDDQRARH